MRERVNFYDIFISMYLCIVLFIPAILNFMYALGLNEVGVIMKFIFSSRASVVRRELRLIVFTRNDIFIL